MTIDLCALRGGAIRRAMTLVEMLIAMALTLILVYAIAEFYAYIGPSVKDGRAMIDLVAQLRTATSRLRADLELITVPMGVFNDDGSSMGYFTTREGLRSDVDANGNLVLDATEDANPADGVNDFVAANVSTMLGDSDDFLAFTIRSDGAPFTGQVVQVNPVDGQLLLDASNNVLTATGASTTAEVAWWTSFSDLNADRMWNGNEPRFLQRRQLLVAPEYNLVHTGDTNFSGRYFVRIDSSTIGPAEAYYRLLQECDVSVRPIGTIGNFTYFVANSLLDLTRRENRFMHVQSLWVSAPIQQTTWNAFPHGVDLNPDFDGDRTQNRSVFPANEGAQWRWVLAGTRLGEDRMLPNVLAFDIRVYDPSAAILADNSDSTGQLTPPPNTADDAQGTVQPGDAGWATALTNNYPIVGYGAYVDLLYNRYATPAASPPNPTPIFAFAPGYVGPPGNQAAYLAALGATYDNWALSYERDGINQNGNALTDEGTNGFDDDGVNGVDDPGERETAAPYPAALRGIQVRLRVYEPTTRQVRQATIGWDFISE